MDNDPILEQYKKATEETEFDKAYHMGFESGFLAGKAQKAEIKRIMLPNADQILNQKKRRLIVAVPYIERDILKNIHLHSWRSAIKEFLLDVEMTEALYRGNIVKDEWDDNKKYTMALKAIEVQEY